MLFEKIIPEKSLIALKQLLNIDIDSIYSDWLSVHKDFVETQLICIDIGKKWINISCECFESPLDNDYYELLVELLDLPKKINYNKTNKTILSPVSAIRFGKKISISSIGIYNRKEIYENEEFYYDVLLLFHCKNQFDFMICLQERVDEALVYSCDESLISKYLSDGLNLRVTINIKNP